MTTEYLVLARAIHFGACLLSFGLLIFDRAVLFDSLASPETAGAWRATLRRFQLVLLPLILLSGAAWFLLVSVNLGDGTLGLDLLTVVWTRTQFGILWHWRLMFWAIMLLFLAGSFFNSWRTRAGTAGDWGLLFSGSLLGSLAWAGHGQETSRWHLLADILHLLAAGCWPAGLLPLFLAWRRYSPPAGAVAGRMVPVILLVRRFSALSLVSVALLSATGLVNGWFLVGSFSNLFSQNYGRWLVLKVLLFILALALGAMNLLWWKPRLSRPDGFEPAAAKIRRNIIFELILAGAVIVIVAVLGILPPAIR